MFGPLPARVIGLFLRYAVSRNPEGPTSQSIARCQLKLGYGALGGPGNEELVNRLGSLYVLYVIRR